MSSKVTPLGWVMLALFAALIFSIAYVAYHRPQIDDKAGMMEARKGE